MDNQLNLVPIVSHEPIMNHKGCLELLNSTKKTLLKEGTGGKSEGLVYKFEPVLLNKYGERLIFKVKFKDFPSTFT